MLGFFKRERYIPLSKILYFYYFCDRVVVVLSNRDNHIVANLNAVIVSYVIIAFEAFIKFHATVNIVLFATLYLPVNRRVEDFAKAIKTDELPNIVGKVPPKLLAVLSCHKFPG